MASVLGWKFTDVYSHNGYAGVSVAETVDDAALATFVGVLRGYSDADDAQRSIKTSVDIPVDELSMGTKGVELRGTVIIKHSPSGRKYTITVPAMVESSIDWNGSAPVRVLPATAEAIRQAFVTMIGGTDGDYVVSRTFAQIKPQNR